MAENSKIEAFVELVLDRSVGGRLDWTGGPENTMFSAALPESGHMLKVFSYSEIEEDGQPSLTIFTNTNQLIIDIRSSSSNNARGEKITRIYDLARSYATGEDKILTEVIDELFKL